METAQSAKYTVGSSAIKIDNQKWCGVIEIYDGEKLLMRRKNSLTLNSEEAANLHAARIGSEILRTMPKDESLHLSHLSSFYG